jgi:serine/threonine protein kinase
VLTRCVLTFIFTLTVDKSFTRKLLHIPWLTREVIEQEARAIDELCAPPGHPHIVEVLKHGEFRNSSYYFINMELCDMTLKDFISSKPPMITQSDSEISDFGEWNTWSIMTQITSGLEYIHRHAKVHRDLKTANGRFLG